MAKAGWIGAMFGVIILGLLFYLSLGLEQYTCEVCMDFRGRQQCRTASGADRETAMRTAQDNACAFVVQSKTEGFLCSQTQPVRMTCQPQ
jgi:hypothetical protein